MTHRSAEGTRATQNRPSKNACNAEEAETPPCPTRHAVLCAQQLVAALVTAGPCVARGEVQRLGKEQPLRGGLACSSKRELVKTTCRRRNHAVFVWLAQCEEGP